MSGIDIRVEVDRYLEQLGAAWTDQQRAALELRLRDGVELAARAAAGFDVAAEVRHVKAQVLNMAGTAEVAAWSAYDALLKRLLSRAVDLVLG